MVANVRGYSLNFPALWGFNFVGSVFRKILINIKKCSWECKIMGKSYPRKPVTLDPYDKCDSTVFALKIIKDINIYNVYKGPIINIHLCTICIILKQIFISCNFNLQFTSDKLIHDDKDLQ